MIFSKHISPISGTHIGWLDNTSLGVVLSHWRTSGLERIIHEPVVRVNCENLDYTYVSETTQMNIRLEGVLSNHRTIQNNISDENITCDIFWEYFIQYRLSGMVFRLFKIIRQLMTISPIHASVAKISSLKIPKFPVFCLWSKTRFEFRNIFL